MRTALALAAALAGTALLLGAPVASGGTTSCTGPQGAVTISGNVSAGPGCVLDGTHVTGNVSVKSDGSLTATNATIDGNVEIQNTSGTNSICGTTIGGDLHVHNNSGTTTIDDSCGPNSVGGLVHIHNNSGQVTISHTDIGGSLSCHNDSPPASTGNGGNTAGGGSTGECSVATTIPCPSTGCTVTVSDGNTDVIVTVPGGGNNGNLTVILSAPPADDGCDVGEGTAPPSGSLVTVDPPSGYEADNPITLDVTYHFNDSLFAGCKSNNGKPPFFLLPICEFPDDSGTPSNVPCLELVGGGDEEAVHEGIFFIKSGDPAVNGHA